MLGQMMDRRRMERRRIHVAIMGLWNKGCYFGEKWEDVEPGVKFNIQNFRTRAILAIMFLFVILSCARSCRMLI